MSLIHVVGQYDWQTYIVMCQESFSSEKEKKRKEEEPDVVFGTKG